MLQHNVCLKPFNTFLVDAMSDHFFTLSSEMQIATIGSLPRPLLFLGGGSNILFTQDYHGTIIHNALMGINVIEENDHSIIIRVGGGENWHKLVLYAHANKWYGLELLALIPGTVGASPVQNIGAYGKEVGELIHTVYVYDTEINKTFELHRDECCFGYRKSIFKTHPSWLITHVSFKLSKSPEIKYPLYPALSDRLEQKGLEKGHIAPLDILDTVIEIREEKLPKVGEIGSAGSFFHNPIISYESLESLKRSIPNLAIYPISKTECKLSAGQLIDTLGWKGKYEKNIGMYEKQALILVNLGGATGHDIFEFSQKVSDDVFRNYKIRLTPEPLII